ncbi:hypothetical protein [Legionella maceachernii]|nr:hypothetical protein [Legionella maceachernii]
MWIKISTERIVSGIVAPNVVRDLLDGVTAKSREVLRFCSG